MDNEIKKLLESIEIDEKKTSLFELREEVLTATPDDAKRIIERLSYRSKWTGKFHAIPDPDPFDNQPYYYLFEAYAHEILLEHDQAINYANRAASLFHMHNDAWNEAMIHWFISVIERARSRGTEACKEMQTAAAILEGISKDFQREGRRGDCQDCQDLLRDLYRHILLSKPFEEITIQNDTEQHLCLSNIPFYNSVVSKEIEVENKSSKDKKSEQVKEKKLVYEWEASVENSFMNVPIVVLGDAWYTIKPIKPKVRDILLEDNKEYGWAKVQDNTMILTEPFGLQNGDYVLFSKQHETAENDVVVVSSMNREPAYLIRRLNKNFLHTSSRIKDDPTPLSDNMQILGVVIAVAKRFIPLSDEDFSDGKLYKFLLRKVKGGKGKIREVLSIEKKKYPYARNTQLLKNIILRWVLNRTWLRFSEWSWFTTGDK